MTGHQNSCLAVLLPLLLLLPKQAASQTTMTVPITLNFNGTYVESVSITATGTISPYGSAELEAAINGTGGLVTFTFITGASSNVVGSYFTASVQATGCPNLSGMITGGTGIFENATGTLALSYSPCGPDIPPTGAIQISGKGTITLVVNKHVDDPCPRQGASSIACQNQSLGEDVPVVGTDFSLHYESEWQAGRLDANIVAAADAHSIGGWTLNVHHAYDPATGTLFLGDGRQRSDWQLAGSMTYNGNHLVAAEDGGEIYIFDGVSGLHRQTLKPMTGAVKYRFGYDAAGKLITVTDGSGNVTTIQRSASEKATAIVSPFSQTTTLNLDSNGFLAQVTDPAGHMAKFSNTDGGLITSRTDANGNVYSYAYDSLGRLTNDADPVGGSTSLSRTDSSTGYTVTSTTALGRKSTYQVATGLAGEQFLNTWPNGLHATMSKLQQSGHLTESLTLPDGTVTNGTLEPDPRWGLQAAIPSSTTSSLGSLTSSNTFTRSTSLGTPGNPFTLTSQTDTRTINGRTFTSTYTASNRTYLNKTPVGRYVTTGLDSLERVASTQLGKLAPIDFAYDSKGRLASETQGTRKTTFSYSSAGFLASITDPLQLTTSFTYDADGRLISSKLPDGRVIAYAYDANGNLTSVTPPGKAAHQFAYTAVNLTDKYTPPADAGTGATTYAYNLDRDLTVITRPDGKTIGFGYDSAGRPNTITTPTETINYVYDTTTGNVSSATVQSGEALAYGYNGPLLTSSTLSGKVTGSVGRTYDDNFWVTAESINGGNIVDYTYDKDGWATNAGVLSITRDGQAGLLMGTSLENVTDSRSYDEYGEVDGYSAQYKTTVLYSVGYTRDTDERIIGKAETIGTQKNTYTYSYDKAGRLIEVMKNGALYSSYTYDSNSNRLTATTSSGSASGTYDAQDRTLTYGGASYTYTANGELVSETIGSKKTSYTYDVLGNLMAVTLPNGNRVSYIIDPENRRVGKELNGVLETGFLYDGDRLVAQLNSSNQVVSRFVYVTGATSPDYMVRGGVTYRIFSDQLGSPVLVVNALTGAIAEHVSYDEFGNVLSDTNPGFQPFGFAGGLYDQDTKLARFGARDYNPLVGRWTAKDPIRFGGGDTDLYGYVLNDPVNSLDPSGLDGINSTNIIKVFDPNSEAAQASRAASKAWENGEHARDLADAYFDKTLGKVVSEKIAKKAKDAVCPGAKKEQEKILEEVRKTIPYVGGLVQPIIRGFLGFVNAITPSSDSVPGPGTPNAGSPLRIGTPDGGTLPPGYVPGDI